MLPAASFDDRSPARISISRKRNEIQPGNTAEQKKTDGYRLRQVAADGRDMVEFRKTAGPDRWGQKAWE